MSIITYSKPSCVQCSATERYLGRTPHSVIDLTEDAEAFATVRALGYLSAPVVIVRDDAGQVLAHWSGFNPDALDRWMHAATRSTLDLAAAA
ncbi:glutaredoxin domain-containing protein [Microbacterium sp. BWR-S6Y]|uniref:glutaredoxin domain-containing protein n=1 Tax=Microbacterium sp. BWR-S6Y TaxID=3232073 RepID=UPI003527CB5D